MLSHPTQRPGVPLDTPLIGSGPAAGSTGNPEEHRIVILQALAASQEVSGTTREWAQHVLKALTGG